jgi:hypothetical protein
MQNLLATQETSRSAQAKNSPDPISTNKNVGIVVYTYHPRHMASIKKRITVLGCSLVVPHLPSMREPWVQSQHQKRKDKEKKEKDHSLGQPWNKCEMLSQK